MTINPLVSADWLHEHLDDENVRVIDASWHMPSAERNGYDEFLNEAIAGAMFFDIDAVSDTSSNIPHMLPPSKQFADAMTALGIENHHHVVVYDAAGLFSAARLWWTLRYFGHEKVSVLDGGLPKWKEEGYPVTQGQVQISSQEPYKIENIAEELCVSKDDVKHGIEQGTHSIFDARGAARFAGTAPEPRAGVKAGHMRGALNIPYTSLLNNDGTMKSTDELKTLFLNTEKPIITSCGSGITACIISLALATLGRTSSVYDGSWAEWGACDNTEVVTKLS